jgi:4-amino-4-deoxy-L-arabinose transferase-like glycosyltransferase
MLVAFALYWLTAARDIVVGDSAEFTTIALSGGVAHPPGYPLLILLARLFSWLPVGAPAFRVNLVSVAAGIATTGLVVLIARRLGASRFGAAIAGLMVAIHPLVWEWSLTIEAFELNAALAAAIVYFLVQWYQQPERTHFLVLAALFGGLASSNHHTIVFLVPSIVLLLWWRRDWLLSRPAVLAACVAAIAVGLLPYLYILWASRTDAVLNWGNVRTFGQLVNHFLRVDYGTFSMSAVAQKLGSPVERLVIVTLSFTLLEAVLLAIGAVVAFARARWFLWFALLAFVLAGPVFIAYANMITTGVGPWIIGHFLVLPHVLLAPFAGLGVTFLVEQLTQRVPSTKPVLPQTIIGLACLTLGAISVTRHYERINQRDNRLASTFAEDIFASLPPRTVLLAQEDVVVLPITYLQAIEKQRADVPLVMLGLLQGGEDYVSQLRRRHPDLVIPFNTYDRNSTSANNKALVDANPGRQFALIGAPLDSSLFQGNWTYQHGLVNLLLPLATDVTLQQAEDDFKRLVTTLRLPEPERVKWGTAEDRILAIYAQPFLRLARQYRRAGRVAAADSLTTIGARFDPASRIR